MMTSLMNEANAIAAEISDRVGILFAVARPVSGNTSSLCFRTADLDKNTGLSLEAAVTWKRIECKILPEEFAGQAVLEIGRASESTRALCHLAAEWFRERNGDAVIVTTAGRFDIARGEWPPRWEGFHIEATSAPCDVEEWPSQELREKIVEWASATAALLVCLLPLDEAAEFGDIGDAEGATQRVHATRYERSPRNRAVCIAINGTACKACGTEFGKLYGPAVSGRIHIHHTVPVSAMGPNYRVNPRTELIPVCPNCHDVIHTRSPPYTVEEVQKMLKSSAQT